MATLAKQPNGQRVSAKSEGSQKKWWLAVLWLIAFLSSTLGLLIPIVLIVFIRPGFEEQVQAEVYEHRPWYGMDWRSYMKFGMSASDVLCEVGFVLGVVAVALAAWRLKEDKTKSWGCAPLAALLCISGMGLILTTTLGLMPVTPH